MVGRVVRESAEFGLRSVAPAELHTFQHAPLIVIVTVAGCCPTVGSSRRWPPTVWDLVWGEFLPRRCLSGWWLSLAFGSVPGG